MSQSLFCIKNAFTYSSPINNFRVYMLLIIEKLLGSRDSNGWDNIV